MNTVVGDVAQKRRRKSRGGRALLAILINTRLNGWDASVRASDSASHEINEQLGANCNRNKQPTIDRIIHDCFLSVLFHVTND
jgi:hypothetical protein